MSQAESYLITPRRNFLKRAFGLTVGGATVAVPILSMQSAEERLEHHLNGVVSAYRDIFPGIPIIVRGNALADGGAQSYAKMLNADPTNRSLNACAMVMVSAGWADEPDRRA